MRAVSAFVRPGFETNDEKSDQSSGDIKSG